MGRQRDRATAGLSGAGVVLAVLALSAAGWVTTGARPAEPQPMFGLSPAEIASSVTAVNAGEIREAQLVLQRSVDPEVRDFAQLMIAEHQKANQRVAGYLARQAPAIVVDEDVSAENAPPQAEETPTGSVTTAAVLQAESARRYSALSSVSEPTFDRAYVADQIAALESWVATLDETLIPAASDHASRKLLKSLRAQALTYADEARRVQTSRGF